MQTTFCFKLMLQIGEIDLFTYPTLTKRPAEIALPGCDNDNKTLVKTLSQMTREHTGTIKLNSPGGGCNQLLK